MNQFEWCCDSHFRRAFPAQFPFDSSKQHSSCRVQLAHECFTNVLRSKKNRLSLTAKIKKKSSPNCADRARAIAKITSFFFHLRNSKYIECERETSKRWMLQWSLSSWCKAIFFLVLFMIVLSRLSLSVAAYATIIDGKYSKKKSANQFVKLASHLSSSW